MSKDENTRLVQQAYRVFQNGDIQGVQGTVSEDIEWETTQWASPTVLLVEPNRLFGDGLALLLEWRMGLRCVRAGSLAEARAILEEADRKPVCAVVDLDLPEGEAAEVLAGLDGVPVLALIGSRDVRRQAEAIALGADEVLITMEAAKKGAVAVQRLIGG